jgi:predicted nucleic acid-binding protein
MAFIVVYDANVLYPNTLRDLLIRIAQQPHLVQAKWTDQIMDETLRALQKNRPDITEEKAARLRELINGAVRDCLVTGYQPLVEALDLPDPDDRHVLAAAIKVNAQLIVTRNLKDFPPKTLAELPRVFRTREFAVILRGCLHFPALVHGLLRGPVPECGVETLPIIAELDVPRDVFACFLPCGVDGTVDSLDFKRAIEALGQRTMPLS